MDDVTREERFDPIGTLMAESIEAGVVQPGEMREAGFYVNIDMPFLYLAFCGKLAGVELEEGQQAVAQVLITIESAALVAAIVHGNFAKGDTKTAFLAKYDQELQRVRTAIGKG